MRQNASKSNMKQEEENMEAKVFDELEAERAAGVSEGEERCAACMDGENKEKQASSAVGEEADFRKNNRGMGTVEIILIIVVLVGLVLIFKNQITQIVNSLFGKITQQTGGF